MEIGILFDTDSRLGDQMTLLAPRLTKLRVEPNQPYGPGDGVTHTLDIHANRSGLLNTMIEVKNNLLDNAEKCQEIASILATLISRSSATFGYRIPLQNDHAKTA